MTVPDLLVADRLGAEYAVILDDVSFEYPDGTQAVTHFSCNVRKGEVLAVVGPSGSGKSTLLRMIAGLLSPTSGTVLLGRDESDGQHGRPVTMIFQEDVLLPWLKVRKNIRLSSTFTGAAAATNKYSVESLLALMGLEEVGDSYPEQLSGGMKRRVGVLQALAAIPSVLLMDEPFSSVDEPTRIGIHGDVRNVLHEVGTTSILVTHDLAEAISMSDRLMIVSKRPASIAYSVDVDLGHDRDMFTLREDPAYIKLYTNLWEELRREIQK